MPAAQRVEPFSTAIYSTVFSTTRRRPDNRGASGNVQTIGYSRRGSGRWAPALPLALVGAAILMLPVTPAAATSPATAPPPLTKSEPVAPNPLRDPRSTLAFLRGAIERGDSAAARRALDFSQVDSEVVRADGDRYVTLLGAILDELEEAELLDPAELPDDPTAPTQTLGRDPILLALERHEIAVEGGDPLRIWRFSASTVADLPELHEQLIQLDEAPAPPGREPPAEPADDEAATPSPQRSPRALLQNFLNAAADAEKDTSFYQAAMAAFDLSQIPPAEREEIGVTRVEQLKAVLGYLVGEGVLVLDDLPEEMPPDQTSWTLGAEPFLAILSRQPDGTWRISSRTVARLPAMHAELRERATGDEDAAAKAAIAGSAFIRLDTTSPQATLNLFLTSMNTGDLDGAMRCLDLSQLSYAERQYAPQFAGKLWLVLNRLRVVVLQEVPADSDSLEPYSMLLVPAGRITIDRVRFGARQGEWLFSASTVTSIERLYRVYETEPVVPELRDARLAFWQLPALYVREYWVPDSAKQPWGGLQVWQWIGLAAVLLVGLIVRLATMLILPRLGSWYFSTHEVAMLPSVWRKALRPTADLLTVLALWGGLQVLDLGVEVMTWAWWGLRIIIAVVAVIAIYRIVDVLMAYFTIRAAETKTRLDDVLVPLIQKTLKVVIVALGLIFIASSFGFQVTPLLAGFGIGGLAFGLAAQDTLKNFFGSINVVLDRPFQVGDWVKMGDVEGTVESVGLRSSRIRTFYNSEVTVPNSEIMNERVDNMGRRKYRRMKFMVSVTYDTKPEQLEAFTEGMRELIRRHPYTRKDYYFCYVNQFAASSIDILLYAFLETPDWATELRERHRLLVDIVRLAKRLNVDFAFPTQTLHVYQEGDPGERGKDFPETVGGAFAVGRAQAQRICAEFLPADGSKPPPVAP
jgi:MscS family membrane protein